MKNPVPKKEPLLTTIKETYPAKKEQDTVHIERYQKEKEHC